MTGGGIPGIGALRAKNSSRVFKRCDDEFRSCRNTALYRRERRNPIQPMRYISKYCRFYYTEAGVSVKVQFRSSRSSEPAYA
jgi:hypothetical protein